LVPRRTLRLHPGVEVSLAFSLDPAPHGFRFGVRAIYAVPTRVVSFKLRVLPRGFYPHDSNQPAILTRPVALRIDPPGASPLPPRPAPYASFAILPCGLPAALVRSYGISLKFTAGSLLYVPVFGRFLSILLPNRRPAASIRLFGTHCLRRELLPTFGISRNPGNVLISP
jgi:hypothetical protein